MAGKLDSKQIPHLPLQPVGSRIKRGKGRNKGGFLLLQQNSKNYRSIVEEALKPINHLQSSRPVDSEQILQPSKSKKRTPLQQSNGSKELIRTKMEMDLPSSKDNRKVGE